ncbi:acyl-protein thioesterase 1 [Cloeon dipterum]|uniref:acyl-protein thioesterase 1 n=1 Tax=Cloeon dipterum TaxID=197152 RepID=UPI00321F74A6
MAASPVVIAASAKHTATVIFLHGLGDTGHGWASGMAAIRPPHVKVICPTAPTMPVTLNAGFRMPSWFDLRSLDADGPEDEEGIKNACNLVHKMIDEEVKEGIASERIVIGGFSQGGALALYSALRSNKTLGGVMALSCWLPMHRQFPGAAVGNKDIPFVQCHGDCDPVVPYKWGQATATLMKQFLSKAEFRTYRGMAHGSSDEEMRDLKKFLEANLPPQ